MGSLLSGPKPKAQQPQIVYYVPEPAPYTAQPVQTITPAAPALPQNQAPAPAAETKDPETEEQKSTRRANNLLQRDRGRLGTILTSTRGLLSTADIGTNRKTLLGE